jgi:gamma-glutamyltranspeptidase/glutathione hydrolase
MKYLITFILILTSCKTVMSPKEVPLSQVSLPASKSRSQYESFGSNWMVASQGVASSQAAAEVLRKGGNLFDAFAALSFAIGVERPHSTGIGGGGFLLFYSAKDQKVFAFDFRETAPRKAHSKMFLRPDGTPDPQMSLTGGLAIATPGHVAGVLEIHQKYGHLKLPEVLAPAIRMAEQGVEVYPALKRAIESQKTRLADVPSWKKIFLTSQGEAWPEGHMLVQKDLAQTIRLISQQGAASFYRGPIARKIVKAVKSAHGIMDQTDLESYQTKWREPVRSTYHDYEIFSQPPPSSGGAHVIEILNIVENSGLKKMGPQSADAVHITASAMQRAFYDRAQYMGDPDFVKVPLAMLVSKDYAARIRKDINDQTVKKLEDLKPKEESPETTHFSLMDSEGNVLVSTQTINGYFGSGLVAEGTGIVLNNEMDDFAAQVGASNLFGAIGGKNNLVAPLKRPLSSMSPTIVLQNSKPVFALGTPSGTRIITCVAQTLLNVLEYDLPLWESVSLTRYHQQWQPDALQMETPLISESALQQLKKKGHQIVEKDLGCRIEAIRKEGGLLHGVSDPREEGLSIGN